jgi:hypothetical protein
MLKNREAIVKLRIERDEALEKLSKIKLILFDGEKEEYN